MTRQELKKAFFSILVGAATAFFASLFTGLAHLFSGNGPELIGGTVAALINHLKTA
jgi:hypothetical protein